MPQYRRKFHRITLGFDLGLVLSGVSYCILEPDESDAVIRQVSQYVRTSFYGSY